MKQYELEKEEKELLGAVEWGGFKSVPNVKKEIARYRLYAAASSALSKDIDLRNS